LVTTRNTDTLAPEEGILKMKGKKDFLFELVGS